MVGVKSPQRSRQHFNESFGILGRPCLLHLAVFAQLVLYKVVGSIRPYHAETIRAQFNTHRAVHVPLGRFQHGFDVPHYGFEILAFVQEHSIPVGNLVFPILLPLAKGELFQEPVGTDYHHRGSRFKAYTPLDAYDGIADVHVATDTVRGADFLDLLYGCYLVAEFLSVHGGYFAFFKTDIQAFAAVFSNLLQIRALRQSLCRIQNLAAANGSSPDAHIIRIFQFREVRIKSVLVQIVDFFLPAQSPVACKRYYFNAGSHHHESHVEAHLVVACAR